LPCVSEDGVAHPLDLIGQNLAGRARTDEAAEQTGQAAASLLDASKDLTRQVEIMRTEVERYISGVKAARARLAAPESSVRRIGAIAT
jgi:hypothetical protein